MRISFLTFGKQRADMTPLLAYSRFEERIAEKEAAQKVGNIIIPVEQPLVGTINIEDIMKRLGTPNIPVKTQTAEVLEEKENEVTGNTWLAIPNSMNVAIQQILRQNSHIERKDIGDKTLMRLSDLSKMQDILKQYELCGKVELYNDDENPLYVGEWTFPNFSCGGMFMTMSQILGWLDKTPGMKFQIRKTS